MPPLPRNEDEAEAVAAAVFTALADSTRRRILTELASGGPATATDLSHRLPISRQAITKHLTLLSDAGLVQTQSVGRRILFQLQSRPMAVAQSFLSALSRDWDTHLRALQHHLDQQSKDNP
ncbi:ArsR/SmtB family transcription factor [Plantactinospora soyae]|uniref:DNA-binding transcriptional ArsR family regulator n=1 Tax=Plantactinospora soyae TaxID=1544732 RepID=A0A927MBS3_9ACTN|nr:winged helix-turn-helix domain-containing protein [Plantactinospora soyae]MBE1490797.1 DNA-binding transcriptional ArsR family regulator [Plantactinospora soyae]